MGNDNTVQKLTFSKNLNPEENFLITDERNAEKNEIIDNINFINKIDFDVLFKLHYNLSLDFNHKLITEIIQKLLKNEHLLQIQIDNIIEEKTKIIDKIENELKIINEKLIDKNIIKEIQIQIKDCKYFLIILLVYTQLNKFQNLKDIIDKIENELKIINEKLIDKNIIKEIQIQIKDCKYFLIIILVYTQLSEINNKLNTHKKLINDISNQQEKLYKIDTSLLEKKIQEINDKLEKLKEDYGKTIVNNIESITKNYKEGDEYLQKQIDESKNYITKIEKEIIPKERDGYLTNESNNYITKIEKEIIPGIDKNIENINDRINKIENNTYRIIQNYETREKGETKINLQSGVPGMFIDNRVGVHMKEGNESNIFFKKCFPLLLIIILICILYILVGIIFWRIKKNKKDCEKRIKELEIYFNQTIIKLEEKIDILNNNTNNSQNYKKKIELCK